MLLLVHKPMESVSTIKKSREKDLNTALIATFLIYKLFILEDPQDVKLLQICSWMFFVLFFFSFRISTTSCYRYDTLIKWKFWNMQWLQDQDCTSNFNILLCIIKKELYLLTLQKSRIILKCKSHEKHLLLL